MPIPKPKSGESKDDFVERCMSNDTMKEEYPDNDQRLAICFSQWKDKKSLDEKEIRCLDVEFRVNREDDGPKIEGYAAVFNKLSEDLGGFREKIKPGAFKKAIKSSDPRALFDHDAKFVLGRKGSGTLALKEDKRGLFFSVSPPATTWANDLMVSIERGDIHQCSFGFTLGEDEWKETKEGVIRTLNQIDRLLDVSVVTYPAYPDTAVALRSMEQWRNTDEPEPIPDEITPIDEKLNQLSALAAEIVGDIRGQSAQPTLADEPLDGEPTQPEEEGRSMSIEELHAAMDREIKLLEDG